MSGDDGVSVVYLLLVLMLPLGALMRRRLGWGRSARLALAWAGIFAIVILLFVERDRLGTIAADARHAFDPEAGVRAGRTLRVPLAADGHYWVRARINGTSVRFLIDSGATTSALGTATAAQAGIVPPAGPISGIAIPIETANGIVMARRARIERLDLGGIVRTDTPVLVAPEFGETNVLGMSFLSSLSKWGVEDRTLVLAS